MYNRIYDKSIFEEDDMDNFVQKLGNFDIKYVHPLKEHSWGQRVVRFYDLDKHINFNITKGEEFLFS